MGVLLKTSGTVALVLMACAVGIVRGQSDVSAPPAISEASNEVSRGIEKKAQSDNLPPVVELMDIDGNRHRPLHLGKAKAAVIIFVLHDCPISNKYAPEIQRLADEFTQKRITFYLVQVDPQLSPKDARQHAKDYRYKLPILLDREHELVRHFKATTAPEVVVIGENQKVLYRGRIDDRYAAVGKPRQQVQRQDLRLALAAIVAEKPIEVAETKAIGCYIPELEEK